MTKRVSHCDVIVRAKAQMPDLLTSPASLHSQSPRVSRRVVWMNSGIRGENVPDATNTTKTSLQSILRQSLFRSLCQVDSLQVKLRALNSMIDKLQSVQKREAGVTATVLLSLIHRIKSESITAAAYAVLPISSVRIQHSWSYCSR